jgi:hypothetical protein
VIILHVRRGHHHGDQQAQRVHHDVPLAPLDLLPRVEALDPADLGRLDRLAIQAARRRLGIVLEGPRTRGHNASWIRAIVPSRRQRLK